MIIDITEDNDKVKKITAGDLMVGDVVALGASYLGDNRWRVYSYGKITHIVFKSRGIIITLDDNSTESLHDTAGVLVLD